MRNTNGSRSSGCDSSRLSKGLVPHNRAAEALKADPLDNFAYISVVTTATAAVVSAGLEAGEVDPFLATRLLCRFLAARGIEVRALPVQATIFNRAAVSNLTKSPLEPNKPIERNALIKHLGLMPGGCFGRRGDSYHGYLVALIDERFIADAASMSASDTNHGPNIDPLLIQVDGGFLQRAEPLRIGLRDGGMIMYNAERGDETYKTMERWTCDISCGFAAVELVLEMWGVRISY